MHLYQLEELKGDENLSPVLESVWCYDVHPQPPLILRVLPDGTFAFKCQCQEEETKKVW